MVCRNKLYKTIDHWSRDMLNFYFLEKGQEIVSPPYDFSRKMVHVIYSIILSRILVSLALWYPWFYLLTKFHYLIAFTSWDIGKYMYSNCLFPSSDVINFEINFFFSVKPVLYLTKKPRFFFHILSIFQGLSVAKNYLRPESEPSNKIDQMIIFFIFVVIAFLSAPKI